MHFSCDVEYQSGNVRKVAIFREKYGCLYPTSLSQNGFCYIFPCYGKLMGKAVHFPCNEVTYPYFGEIMDINFTDSSLWIVLHLPMLWEIGGKANAFPVWWDPLFFPFGLEIRYEVYNQSLHFYNNIINVSGGILKT